MHRPIAALGLTLVVVGFGLVAFPVIVFGREQLDPEQIVGFLVVPLGTLVVMVAAASGDPRRTTIAGTFGNPEEARPSPPTGAAPGTRPRLKNPFEAVHCEHCRTIIASDLAACPRCARARECRSCGRPLGLVLDRPTCPSCARAEAFCSCATLPRPSLGRARRWEMGG